VPPLVRVILSFSDGSSRELVGAEAQRWFAWVQRHIDWDKVTVSEDGMEPFVWIDAP
jgi:hypothetical protein